MINAYSIKKRRNKTHNKTRIGIIKKEATKEKNEDIRCNNHIYVKV